MKQKLAIVAGVAVVIALLVGVPALASTEESSSVPPDTRPPVAPNSMVADAAPNILSDGSVVMPDSFPGVRAIGRVPEYLETAAANGNAGAKVAKYMWQHGAKVVPLGNGQYAIPMPDRIPPGISWPSQSYPSRPVGEDTQDGFQPVPPPLFLDPAELALWDEVMSQGQAFTLEQGQDGYVHIITSGEVGK